MKSVVAVISRKVVTFISATSARDEPVVIQGFGKWMKAHKTVGVIDTVSGVRKISCVSVKFS